MSIYISVKQGDRERNHHFFFKISPINTPCDLPAININKPDLVQQIIRNCFLCCHWYEEWLCSQSFQVVYQLCLIIFCILGFNFFSFEHKNIKSAEFSIFLFLNISFSKNFVKMSALMLILLFFVFSCATWLTRSVPPPGIEPRPQQFRTKS